MEQIVLLLAQLCVAEIGFPAQPANLVECQLMWAINEDRAERWRQEPPTWAHGHTVENVSWLYNSVFKCEHRKCDTPRMRWVRALNLRGDQPIGWEPSAGKWAGGKRRFRKRWLRVIAFAERWLTAGRPWPRVSRSCRRLAVHYGGAMDSPRECWSQVECGGAMRQRYWSVKSCSRNFSGSVATRAGKIPR